MVHAYMYISQRFRRSTSLPVFRSDRELADVQPFINSDLLSFFVSGVRQGFVYDPPFELRFQQVISAIPFHVMSMNHI